MKRPLCLSLIALLLPVLSSSQTHRQPVIDMHMHAYEGALEIPNPNTGEILVHDGEEHRRVSLRFMDPLGPGAGCVAPAAGP